MSYACRGLDYECFALCNAERLCAETNDEASVGRIGMTMKAKDEDFVGEKVER